jgi:hypothetical protein
MGGSGKTTTEVKVPAWLENAAQKNLAKADALAQIGYTPYYGPDVAAMTPMQMASMQGTNTAASAFGLPTADPMAGAPTAMNYGGMPAYSSGGMYDQALAELQRRQPAQYEALRAPFIDPVTGAQPAAPFGSGSTMGSKGGADAAPVPAPVPAPVAREGGGGSMSSGMSSAPAGRGTTSMATPASYLPGGVNTNNPNSVVNRVAAALSGPQGAPTAANRPAARPASVAPAPARTVASAPSTAARDRERAAASAANKAAASKAQREMGEGKGGKSGPKGGSSSGGSNKGRR